MAVYLILKKGDHILCARRCNTGYADGQYSLPAGHLEKDETVTDAVIREVREEVGIVLSAEAVKVDHVLYRTKKSEEFEYVDFFFSADRWQGEVSNKEPEKCDDLRWFPVSQLPEKTLDYVRHVIDQIDKGSTFSEYIEV